jgi:predicted alpha/beta-fold hydrolase
MRHIGLPALAINALNDPFVPASSLPQERDVSADVTLWQPPQGGHVGFARGAWPGDVRALPEAVAQWWEQTHG